MGLYRWDIRAYNGTNCSDCPAAGEDGFIFSFKSSNTPIFIQVASSDKKIWFRFYHTAMGGYAPNWTQFTPSV